MTSLQAMSEELEAMSTSAGVADQLRDFKALVNQLAYQADQILPSTGKALSELFNWFKGLFTQRQQPSSYQVVKLLLAALIN
nr:hypothetical protein [Streptococcus equi]